MSAVKFELDTREFTECLRQYADVSKKDEIEVVKDRAGKVAFELFKQFKVLAPTVQLLRGLPASLNYHIKRKFAGATIKQEINRRIRARFSSAGGWLPAVKRFTRKGAVLRNVKNPKGHVEINLSEPSVTIVNSMKEAVAAEGKHHVMQAALNAQVADMRIYIERKMDQRAKQFSAK